MKLTSNQCFRFGIRALIAGNVLLFVVASDAANVSPDDLFLPPSIITNGFYDTHILTVGSGTNVIQTYTSADVGGTLLGVRILPILNPNPRPTSFQAEYTPDDLANINVTNYSQFFLCQPGTDYLVDLTPDTITVDYRTAGQYFVEIRAETGGLEFTNVYVDRVDDFVGQGAQGEAGNRRQLNIADADVRLVGSADGGDSPTNHYLEAAAGVLKDAGKTVATVSNVDAIITATASAYAANGSNQVELMLVAHGEEIVDKLGEHLGYGIRIGNQVITTCEGVEGGISAEEFQTNIDKFVNSIHLYCCNVGQDTNLMNALSSIWFVTAFTNKVQADRTGTLQTNADRTVTRIKGFTIPEGATELALLNPGVYPINLNWTNLLGGLWSNPTNWSCDPGFVKNSTNVFYDPGFIVCLTNDMTTTIDLWLAVRRLCFSDRSCRHVFFINPGSGGGLILGATNGSPAIFVYGPTTTTINAPVAASDGFLKCGSGTLTLGASNSITGPLIVKFGTLRVGNPSALGTTNNSVFIADGATLDVNGINLGAEPITVSGAGVDGHGGIVNNGATQINALQCVTLAGDTTFGGTNRWDIRSASSTNAAATLSTGGNACNLTKTDGNQVSLAGVQVDAGLGDINLLRGILSLEGLSLPTSFLEVVEVV